MYFLYKMCKVGKGIEDLAATPSPIPFPPGRLETYCLGGEKLARTKKGWDCSATCYHLATWCWLHAFFGSFDLLFALLLTFFSTEPCAIAITTALVLALLLPLLSLSVLAITLFVPLPLHLFFLPSIFLMNSSLPFAIDLLLQSLMLLLLILMLSISSPRPLLSLSDLAITLFIILPLPFILLPTIFLMNSFLPFAILCFFKALCCHYLLWCSLHLNLNLCYYFQSWLLYCLSLYLFIVPYYLLSFFRVALCPLLHFSYYKALCY